MASSDDIHKWERLNKAMWTQASGLIETCPALEKTARAFIDNGIRVRRLVWMMDSLFVAGRRFENRHEAIQEPMSCTSGDFLKATPDLELMPVFFSVITGAWTAFEVLASDLWVAALNSKPEFAFEALNAVPHQSDNDKERDEKRRKSVKFPVRLMRKWNFNLTGNIGTLLYETKAWEFDRMPDAKKAYQSAFKAQATDFEAIFDHPRVRCVSAVRQVIVHNGGIADAEFLGKAGSHAVLGKAVEGSPIPMDAEICLELSNAAIEGGWALIRVVDGIVR